MKSNLTGILLCGALALLPAHGQSAGYWRTSGNQILDANNQPVRIAGVNWYGFETTAYTVHGLWAQDYKTILNTVHGLGYNTVRIPFSNQMVETNPPPSSTAIQFSNANGPINTDLRNLTALQILDRVIAYAGQIGLRVILDNHRSSAGDNTESALWYTTAYPHTAWMQDWQTLAARYANNPTVVGFDLRNEPHDAATWGSGDPATDWRWAAQQAGNAILAMNPNVLILVEGIQNFNGDQDNWGGNLEGARQFPVVLNTPGQLVYSPHNYGPSNSAEPWFNSGTTYNSLVSVWTQHWAYLANSVPVVLGEFGTGNNDADVQASSPGSQGQWFQSMIQFLQNTPAIGWTYWALNGEDGYGLLDGNYDATPASSLKQQKLASVQFALSSSPAYRVNAGGFATGTFSADAFFSGGAANQSTTNNIDLTGVTNPAPAAVYQTERYGNNYTNFSYAFPNLTPNAAYTVRLHFAEDYWTAAGQRKFNVVINGNEVLDDFDIYAVAGTNYKALVKEFTRLADGGGVVNVQFNAGSANYPKVNGIEVVSSSARYVTNIWWPIDDSHVSGTVPFKVVVPNLALSQYSMYWQVDGGQLVAMADSLQDAPHKEASVDLSGWTWRGAGPYHVNFVAKDPGGTVIVQSAIDIWIGG